MLLVANIGLQLTTPQVLRHFIDAARRGGDLAALGETAVLYLAVLLISQAASVAVLYLGTDVGWTATNLLRADLLAHVLRLDLQ